MFDGSFSLPVCSYRIARIFLRLFCLLLSSKRSYPFFDKLSSLLLALLQFTQMPFRFF